jgi:hypothetical protein
MEQLSFLSGSSRVEESNDVPSVRTLFYMQLRIALHDVVYGPLVCFLGQQRNRQGRCAAYERPTVGLQVHVTDSKDGCSVSGLGNVNTASR